MNTPQVKVGDPVLYIPENCHQYDTNAQGDLLFEFVFAENAPNSAHSYKKGDVVQNHGDLGQWQHVANGVIHTLGGHKIKPSCCRQPWPAVVREVFADGTVALDIQHPVGGVTLHYPAHYQPVVRFRLPDGTHEDRQMPPITTGLRYSAAPLPHTWHLPKSEGE